MLVCDSFYELMFPEGVTPPDPHRRKQTPMLNEDQDNQDESSADKNMPCHIP